MADRLARREILFYTHVNKQKFRVRNFAQEIDLFFAQNARIFWENSARNYEILGLVYEECIENFKIALQYFIVVVTSAFNNVNDAPIWMLLQINYKIKIKRVYKNNFIKVLIPRSRGRAHQAPRQWNN